MRLFNIFFIFMATFFGIVNFYTSLTIIPLYTIELGGDEFYLGLQSSIYLIVAVFLRLYFGPLGDRKGKKIPLLIGTFIFATAPLLYMWSNSLWGLTFVRIYDALALATFISTSTSVVADLAPKENLGTYMGFFRLIYAIAILCGPSSAVYIIQKKGFAEWFLIDAILGLLSFYFIIMLKIPINKADPVPDMNINYSPGTNLLKDNIAVLKEKGILPVYLGVAMFAFSYGGLLAYVLVYITKVSSVSNPGIYFTYFAITSIIGNIIGGYCSDRFGRAKVAWLHVIVLGMGIIILYYLPASNFILVASSVLCGFGYSAGYAAVNTWLVDVAKENNRATAFALSDSVYDIAMGASSLFIGLVGKYLTLRTIFMIVGAVVVTLGILLLFYKVCRN